MLSTFNVVKMCPPVEITHKYHHQYFAPEIPIVSLNEYLFCQQMDKSHFRYLTLDIRQTRDIELIFLDKTNDKLQIEISFSRLNHDDGAVIWVLKTNLHMFWVTRSEKRASGD